MSKTPVIWEQDFFTHRRIVDYRLSFVDCGYANTERDIQIEDNPLN